MHIESFLAKYTTVHDSLTERFHEDPGWGINAITERYNEAVEKMGVRRCVPRRDRRVVRCISVRS
jgi:hypothetical protein